MDALRPLALCTLAAASLAISAASAGAEVLDQSQELFDNAHANYSGLATWQTFTPAIAGRLSSVELRLRRLSFVPGPPYGDLHVSLVTTAGGVPTATELGTVTIGPDALEEGTADWVAFDFSGLGISLDAETVYAIRLTSPETTAVPGWEWQFEDGGAAYARGAFFRDLDAADGLDDPSSDLTDSDATFRTFMSTCGNDELDSGEECDDGNTTGGDGCSASCTAEVCGDGVMLGPETCDDGGTAAGDGCSETCQIERPVAACQAAIAKAGASYAKKRLAAIQDCRARWMKGKTTSVASPGECAAEAKVARKIERAGAKARRQVAAGKRPKCSDALLGVLSACADNVDALVAADGRSGCLLSTHDAAVDALLEAEYGY